MRNLLIPALAFLFIAQSYASNEAVDSKVDEVTFFLSGAQVKRSAPFQFRSGVHEVVLHDLEPGIDPGSIILTGQGDFTLLSYRHETRTVQPDDSEPPDSTAKLLRKKIKAAEDSLTELTYWRQDLSFRLEVVKNEKRLLLNNPINQGAAISDSLQLLQDAVAYLRQQLNEVNAMVVKLNREKAELNAAQNHLDQRLAALRQDYNNRYPKKNTRYDYRIVLAVDAEKAGSGQVNFSYLVRSAGWTPEIEFRSQGYGKPMILQQRAQLYQKTGKDWNNVELFVSTGNPISHRNKPMLQPWVLRIIEASRVNNTLKGMAVYEAISADMEAGEEMVAEQDLIRYHHPLVSTTQQLAYRRYSFDRKFSIRGNASYTIRVKLDRAELDCAYRLVAVPKLDERVYVQARFTDWQEYMLPNAQAKLYYENTFIGQIQLDGSLYTDTLELSMGIDEGLRVTRELIMSKSKNKIIGNKSVQERIYRYIAQNFRSTEVRLYVQDHLPLSRQDGLEIEKLECGDGRYTASDGMIEWELILPAKGTKEFECGSRIS